MKILVLYDSKYGSTKQYAQWIAEELHADIASLKGFNPLFLKSYGTIIFGSHLHVGKIVNASFLTENWENIKAKKVILFTVSGTKPGSRALTKFYEASFPENVRKSIKYFQFWGRIANLDLGDSILISFPKTLLKMKAMSGKEKDEEALQEFLLPFGNSTMTKDAIFPLIQFVNQ